MEEQRFLSTEGTTLGARVEADPTEGSTFEEESSVAKAANVAAESWRVGAILRNTPRNTRLSGDESCVEMPANAWCNRHNVMSQGDWVESSSSTKERGFPVWTHHNHNESSGENCWCHPTKTGSPADPINGNRGSGIVQNDSSSVYRRDTQPICQQNAVYSIYTISIEGVCFH